MIMQTERRQAFDIKSLIGNQDDRSKERRGDGTRNVSASSRQDIVKFNPHDRKASQGLPKTQPVYHQNCFNGDCQGRYNRRAIQRNFKEEHGFQGTHANPQPIIPRCHDFHTLPVAQAPCKCNQLSNPDTITQCPSVQQSYDRLISSHLGHQDVDPFYFLHPGVISAFSVPYPRHELLTPQNNSRRIRTTFSQSQLNVLEKRFKTSHYIVGDERKQLAHELGLNESQVKIWFQNRRTKYKQEKEFEEMGKSRNTKRKGEHHIRKWQIDTKLMNTQK